MPDSSRVLERLALAAFCLAMGVGVGWAAVAETLVNGGQVVEIENGGDVFFREEMRSLLNLDLSDLSEWDETRCEAALARVTNVLAFIEQRTPVTEEQVEALKGEVLDSGKHRRRIRRVQIALDRLRTIEREFKGRLNLDPAVQKIDREMDLLDRRWRRLITRKGHIHHRLNMLAEASSGDDARTVSAGDIDYANAEAMSRLPLDNISRWDRASCENVLEHLKRHASVLIEEQRPNMRRLRNEIELAQRESEGYEKDAGRVRSARQRYIRLKTDLDQRVDRDSTVKQAVAERDMLEDHKRRLILMGARIRNRQRIAHFVEAKSGESGIGNR